MLADGAMERLITLLDKAGRKEEADALIDAEKKRPESQQKSSMTLFGGITQTQPIQPPGDTTDGFYGEDHNLNRFPEPYTRPSPKIVRNDPCPCSSGEKYKKCSSEKETT